ncbi:unnamed protein product [Caenorhabditis auriculariae]|uniref:Transmembrane protein n=1 Tax=Caenorhabditis auriculariae TaxID=2777116 RepID=A0A8S1GXD2_9PELO|nr:unnamed protein product [Caenorhabditis auriculariae]
MINIFLVLNFAICALGLVQIQLNHFFVDFNGPISQLLPNCVGVDTDFGVYLTDSNYSALQTFSKLQQNAVKTTMSIDNSTLFTLPSATSFVSVAASFSIRCSTSPYPITDMFLIFTDYKDSVDENSVSINVRTLSVTYGWVLTCGFVRFCETPTEFGFNCDQHCLPVNDMYFCYTCDGFGRKLCCDKNDVNQSDCSYNGYTGPTPSTTTVMSSTNCNGSSAKENAYFWSMIGLAILSAILLLLLIIALGWLFLRRKELKEDESSKEEKNKPKNSKASRESRPVSRNSGRRSRRPYYIDDHYFENQGYDDDTLADEWVEPMPRRVARV